jgi:hypothetical protein
MLRLGGSLFEHSEYIDNSKLFDTSNDTTNDNNTNGNNTNDLGSMALTNASMSIYGPKSPRAKFLAGCIKHKVS